MLYSQVSAVETRPVMILAVMTIRKKRRKTKRRKRMRKR